MDLVSVDKIKIAILGSLNTRNDGLTGVFDAQ